MSDMTHCAGSGCPLKNGCLRFRAVAYGRFDAFGSVPWDAVKRTCAHYLDVTELASPTDEAIRFRAYMRWRAAGSPEGTADADWRAAQDDLAAELSARLRPPEE